MNISSFKDFINKLEMYGDRIAIKERNNGVFVDHTYSDLIRDVIKTAESIKKMNISSSNIAIISENSYKWIVSFLGIIMSNNVAIPLDKDIQEDVMNIMIKKMDIKLAFASNEFLAFLDMATDERFVSLDEIEENKTEINHSIIDEINNEPDTVTCIILTSGTSGYNKAVQLTHRNICSNLNAIVKFNVIQKNEGNFVSILPLYHSYELFCDAMPCLMYGHTMVIDNNIRNYIKNINEFKPEVHVVVPSLLNFLNKKISTFGGFRFKIIVGGASVDNGVYRNMINNGFEVYVGYGMSEASPLISVKTNFKEDASVNDLFFTNIKIDSSKEGEEGEILLKGDNITPGYYGDEESTTNSFTKDGWFKTGDLGYIVDNKLHFTGRLKNTIILENGKNVQPEQIEELIYEKLAYIDDVVVCEFNINNSLCIGAVIYSSSINLQESPDVIIEDIKKVNEYLEPHQKIMCISISNTLLPKNKIMKTIRKSVKDRLKEYKQYIIM